MIHKTEKEQPRKTEESRKTGSRFTRKKGVIRFLYLFPISVLAGLLLTPAFVVLERKKEIRTEHSEKRKSMHWIYQLFLAAEGMKASFKTLTGMAIDLSFPEKS